MTQASREQLYRDIAANACYRDDYQSAGSDYQRLRMRTQVGKHSVITCPKNR